MGYRNRTGVTDLCRNRPETQEREENDREINFYKITLDETEKKLKALRKQHDKLLSMYTGGEE